MIARMQGLKRKMESLQEEEKKIQTQSKKRIQHLQDLYKIQTLADVKYEEWSRTRLDRLIVDHMLRSGFPESAKQLAKAKDIEDLVDTGTFVQCQRIAESLRSGDAKEALQWCGENKVALKKSQVCTIQIRLIPIPNAEYGLAEYTRIRTAPSAVYRNGSDWTADQDD
jgi:macrophage erythroblast attacher